jgi:hypothetical protein
MNDKPKIIVGLAVALVALGFPFWYGLVPGHGAVSADLELPKGDGVRCVESKEYMRAHHMELLDHWRQSVVRDGDKSAYVSIAYGTKCEKSLTNTCIGCHTNQETFCDRCHVQANVRPACWDCHNASAKAK